MFASKRGVTLAVATLVALSLLGAKWYSADRHARYEVVPVARGDIETTVSAIGTLKPRHQVEVGARVSGQIDRLHVKVGDRVEKGQLLVEIDPRIPRATVNAGRAQLANLEAQLTEARARHELTRQQMARQQQMHKDRATRLEDVQTAVAEHKMAIARIEQLKAQIEQTQSTLSGDEAQLDYTRIYAPMAGTVVSLSAEEGQTLNATYQTPALLRIADLSTMTVWAEVSEADVVKVKAGMPVYFTTLGGNGRRWPGQVRQVLPAPADPEGKSAGTPLAPSTNKVILYTVLFDVDNADGALMAQMTAQVSFVVDAARDALLVPLPALDASAEKPGHFQARILNAAGEAELREVRVGVRNRLSAQVLAGLEEGERLITGEGQGGERPARFQW
ncbi:efflux RND transporter periplasmic adaptor subunit [Zestomonas carbonaria]|uniref:Macrolide export protein MacA n=1 Tax=Zestomonas carbonaria TaxID=2762745 RepID=A0A7U7ENY4_9GAMM|nr:efflux RND transporter periplasmic adaptor subunit [Pseudomonas carbonaria]CAD5108469.1 Macrolide export protein MacA [Pseudomonas carbonaria]